MLTSARSATCSQLQRTTLALTSARIPVLVASEPSSSRPSYHEPHARRSFSKFPLRRAKDAASGSGKKPHSMVKMVLDWEGLSSRTNVGKARREELMTYDETKLREVFEAAIDSAQPPQLSEPSSSSSPVDVSEALATLTPTKRAEIVRDILLAEGFEAKKQTKEKKARRAELTDLDETDLLQLVPLSSKASDAPIVKPMPISTLHLPELSLSLHPYASPNDQPILLSQTLSRTIKRLERQGVCITTLSSPPVPSLYPSPPSTAVISFTVSRSSPWILSPEHDMYIHSPSLSPIARPEPFTVSLIPPALLVQLMLATPASEAAGNGKQMQNSGMEKLLREIAVQTETEHVEKGKEMQKVLLVVGLEEYLAEEVGSVEKSLFRKRLLGGWLRERCFLNEVETVFEATLLLETIFLQIANRPYKLHERTHTSLGLFSSPNSSRRISSPSDDSTKTSSTFSSSPTVPSRAFRSTSSSPPEIYRKFLEQLQGVTPAAAQAVAQHRSSSSIDGVEETGGGGSPPEWATLRGLMEGFERAERRGEKMEREERERVKAGVSVAKRGGKKRVDGEWAREEGRKMLADVKIGVTANYARSRVSQRFGPAKAAKIYDVFRLEEESPPAAEMENDGLSEAS